MRKPCRNFKPTLKPTLNRPQYTLKQPWTNPTIKKPCHFDGPRGTPKGSHPSPPVGLWRVTDSIVGGDWLRVVWLCWVTDSVWSPLSIAISGVTVKTISLISQWYPFFANPRHTVSTSARHGRKQFPHTFHHLSTCPRVQPVALKKNFTEEP